VKLWGQAIDRLDFAQQRGARVREAIEKFYVEPKDVFTEPLPVGPVYALREGRPPHAPGIEKPSVVDATLLVHRNAYRPLLVRRLGQQANYFHAVTAIANVAGIFCLTRPLDFARMPEVVAWLEQHWLEQHWLELRLMEKAA
jgi:hypothetical protein